MTQAGPNYYRNQRNRERKAARDAAYEAEQAEEARKRAEKDEEYRYLPASYRSMDELREAIGAEAAEKVKSLIEDMIQEAAAAARGSSYDGY